MSFRYRISDSAIEGVDIYAAKVSRTPRDDAFYHRALSRIPETDRLIPQLRSPLAFGAAEQWERAKANVVHLFASADELEVTAAMQSAQQVDRISSQAVILAGAEREDENARLAIVEDLVNDLVFAENYRWFSYVPNLGIEMSIHRLTDQARALKGDLRSPQFFQNFLSVVEDYAEVVTDARSWAFANISRDIDFVPPRFGDELFVFGAGYNGFIPWQYASAVHDYID
nr:Uncharacterised protein [Streptococcus thermophilus]